MTKKTTPKRGRPAKEFAGDVQARILDAAQQLFLDKGYRSASIDDISELAPASKPTIYAHFQGKEALFAAVVARTISGLSDFENFEPEGRTLQDKLMSLGTRDRGEGNRRIAGDGSRHDRGSAAFPGAEPQRPRRRAGPLRGCHFSAAERDNPEGRARAKRTLHGQAQHRHRSDLPGSDPAPDAFPFTGGRNAERPATGVAVFRAGTRPVFPLGVRGGLDALNRTFASR
ncbi:AcrR family transcriptional regulator [Bradyrhizobium sp. F1.13.1]